MVNLPQYTEVLTANGCLQDKEYANYSLLSIPLSGSDTSYSSYLYTSHADTSPTKSYMCCALKSHTINQSSLRVDIFVIGYNSIFTITLKIHHHLNLKLYMRGNEGARDDSQI